MKAIIKKKWEGIIREVLWCAIAPCRAEDARHLKVYVYVVVFFFYLKKSKLFTNDIDNLCTIFLTGNFSFLN